MESVRKRIASHRVITICGCLFHPIFWLYFFSKLVWPQNVFRIVQLVLNSINKLFQRMLFFAMSLLRFFTDGPFLSFQSLRITLSVIKTYQNPVQLLLWDSSSFRHICWDTCIWIQMKLLFDYTFWTFMEVFSGPKCFSFFLALQTEIFSYKHCLLSTSSRNPIFSCEQVPQEVFGRFYTESAFRLETFWTRSQICQRPSDLLEQSSLIQTYIHTYRQPEWRQIRALEKPKHLSESLNTIRHHTARKAIHDRSDRAQKQEQRFKFFMSVFPFKFKTLKLYMSI